jgi:Spy/CpxP family protein refolding chaperone
VAGEAPFRPLSIEESPVFRHHLGALALLAAFALPLCASAQTVPAPDGAAPAPAVQQHHHHHNPYMRAMRSLKLSDAQKQQIAGFMKSSREANKGADPQTRRANIQALRQQIEGVLTDDQRTQLHATLARERAHMVKPNGPAPQAPPQ